MKIPSSLSNSLSALAVMVLTAVCSLGSTALYAQGSKNPPKLILQITVDQLRGDLPTRYYDRLGEGGFKFLWESGVVYRNAFHAHANTLIVLSADHGGPDAPGYLESLKIPAGYIELESWDKLAAITRIKDRFQIEGQLIERYAHPYVYLSTAIVENPNINREALEAALVDELSKFQGVSLAISSSALRRGNVPDTQLYRSVLNNFHVKRSGDIYVIFEPNWFINDFDGLTVASTHGSPWQYDTYVPIVFAGAGLTAKTVNRRVHTIDIAPTLSAYLGIKPPSGSQGILLKEVLE